MTSNNPNLIAAAADLLEAAETHLTWIERERQGPLYPARSTRDSPGGEEIWRAWWEDQLRLCALTEQQCRAAIARATGSQEIPQ